MGIDLVAGGRHKSRGNRLTTSTNTYLKLLIKLYRFLARRTESRFNKVILKRLNQSKTTRYPISISRLTKYQTNAAKAKPAPSKDKAAATKKDTGADKKILVIVATVTNDVRLLEVPKLNVCALRFTEKARQRILAAGGKCYTFDQLASIAPTGTGTVLLRGPRSREALKHFGLAPGIPGSRTKPYVRQKGKRLEHAHGLR